MNRLVRLIVTWFFTCVCLQAMAATPADTTPDPNAEMVKRTITAFMKKNNIPGVAVQLYVDGIPHSYYFGYANREKKKPVTDQTIFEVGSISKIMTSILLTEQIDIAKMSLEDPVTKYMEELPDSFDNITLQSLATNTSGLPFSVPESVKSQDDLTKYVENLSLANPEHQWAYSNVGTGILGNAVEKVTHKDINELFLTHILSPLGMQPIGFNVPSSLKAFYAQGYNRQGRPVDASKPGFFPAASGAKLSASDMQRFLSASIGLPGTPPRIFYPMRMTQTAYVKLPDQLQGLAWQIHPLANNSMSEILAMPAPMDGGPVASEVLDKPNYTGDALIDKTGATNGFHAYLAVIPNKKSGIAILANKTISNDAIVTAGREILFKSAQIASANEQVKS